MGEAFTILVADRNPRVREFLRRELIGDGYQVRMAKDGRELLRMITQEVSPDLLILDLELPFVDGLEVLERLKRRSSALPVIIHAFFPEDASYPSLQYPVAIIEKTGTNIDKIKGMVASVLRKAYPHRCTPMHAGEDDQGTGDTMEVSHRERRSATDERLVGGCSGMVKDGEERTK